MKIYRTKNIEILKTWLIGGQTNQLGGNCEGFHSLTMEGRNNGLIKNDQIDLGFLISEIEACIEHYGNETFKYYENKYRFSEPSSKNFNKLLNEIMKDLQDRYFN